MSNIQYSRGDEINLESKKPSKNGRRYVTTDGHEWTRRGKPQPKKRRPPRITPISQIEKRRTKRKRI
jgi:hypothetical protein